MTHAHSMLDTNTYTCCVIFIAYPLQQWVHERTSLLRYTYIASHVQSSVTFFLLGINIFSSILSRTPSARVLPSVAVPHTAFFFNVDFKPNPFHRVSPRSNLLPYCFTTFFCAICISSMRPTCPTHLTCSLITLLVREKVHL